ncbi:MAG: TetR/AcrR family transcriptional regulator, partial [Actinobacteria bacterium]|nr:TetR/AcrR family transcriptional regulator [Actinomycetota bacterium]
MAAALMYERGVRATGLQDVLAGSRSGKSQFYHYFSSKDELVAAVLEYQLMIVLGELEGFRIDTWRGMRSWFDALLDGQEQRGFKGCPVGSLSIELSAGDRCMQGHVADAFSRWETALARAFAAMKARRSLDDSARPQTLAEATLAAIQGG